MRDEASHGAEVSLFGQFWPRYTARISARGIARPPFQTVSQFFVSRESKKPVSRLDRVSKNHKRRVLLSRLPTPHSRAAKRPRWWCRTGVSGG